MKCHNCHEELTDDLSDIYGYKTDKGDIYFEISKDKDYGKLEPIVICKTCGEFNSIC